MGLTYKENVADIVETPVKEIIKGFREYGVEVHGYEALLDDIEDEFRIKLVWKLEEVAKVDCVILAAAHGSFIKVSLDYLKRMMTSDPILIDVGGVFDPHQTNESGIYYCCL